MQALQNQLDSVRTLLEQHSEHSTDNVSLVSPSGDGKKIPSTRLFLLLEYNLFDLSSHHQCCRHLLTNIFRALTEREKEVKGLHQVMGLLSRCRPAVWRLFSSYCCTSCSLCEVTLAAMFRECDCYVRP